MSFSGLTLVHDCGFGGCQAPVRPVPVFCPSSFGNQQDEVGKPIWFDLARQQELVVALVHPLFS